MYIDIDRQLRIHLMDMTFDEAGALLDMIRGTSPENRRVFHHVREQLERTPIDELIEVNQKQNNYEDNQRSNCERHHPSGGGRRERIAGGYKARV